MSQKLSVEGVELAITNAKREGVRVELKDLGSPGLVLRVGATGGASWCFRFGSGGHRVTLGKYPHLTLKQARDVAAGLRKKVADGINPLELRRAARAAITLEKFAETFRERHLRNVSKRTATEYGEMIDRKIIPGLGSVKVRDLDRPEVIRWHQGLVGADGKGGRQANYALAVLSRMMTLAELWGERPEGSNPCKRVQRYHEERRQRYLAPEELQRLAGKLGEGPAYDGIRLLILTGIRLGELLALTWPMVDLVAATFTFPAGSHKTGRKVGSKTIPIPIAAVALLEAMPKMLGSKRVIPGSESQMEHAWREVRDEAKLTDVRLHDLRHTFASYGAAKGLSLPIIGALLGHGHAATTQRYAHLAQSPLRDAVEQIGTALSAAMAGKKKAPGGA